MSKKIGNDTNVVAKKRGRKSKKEIEEAAQKSLQSDIIVTNIISENIVVKMVENQETYNNLINTSCIDAILNSDNDNDNNNNDNNIEIDIDNDIDNDNENDADDNQILNTPTKPPPKKRGRKPKGGKIIQQLIPLTNIKETKPNVILHLKCSLKDLHSSSLFNANIDSFSFLNKTANLTYDQIVGENNLNDYINQPAKLPEYDVEPETTDFDNESLVKNKETDIRDIWKKLKVLEHNLHVNNIDNKKSACFWDTCEFDNPPVYIPKYFMNDTYHVYGCFCSPECAVAHLMEENIDTSIKFERYQLINHIYSKVYNYNKNIKPSPNPYYMLEKYCGNLNIQEYRALLKNERLFLVVDKPLTRVMPELHEDNDDFIINNKIIPTNNFKLRKIQRKQTKTNILNERFGLTNA
jgi:hypothetical protein